MTWLLIIFILALIIGPILALIPSPRQKEQTAFRNEAKSRGISVELCSIEDPDPNPDNYLSATGKRLDPVIKCIAYRIARKRPLHWQRAARIHWKLIQTQGARLADLPDGWKWHEPAVELAEVSRQSLIRCLPQLPDDVIAVEESNYVVSVYWHEKGGTDALEGVCTFLEGFKGEVAL
jgi:hypothetical protein